MNSREVGLDGNITFYSITEWTSRSALMAGLEAIGLGSYVPEPRTPPAAFKDALEEVFAGPGWIVKRLKDTDSFEVVKQELRPYPQHNLRTDYCVGRIDHKGEVVFNPMPDEALDVVAAYNRHLGMLRPPQVGKCLVGIVYHLKGTALRPSGGVYWLPAASRDKWVEVGKVIESSGVVGQSKLYVVQHPMTPDSVRAVSDALRTEVMDEVSRLDADINEGAGKLGERALRNRESQCYALRRKIREYEECLGTSLKALAAEVERVEDAACLAALTASVATEK